MISYVYDIGERARSVSRFISDTRSELQNILMAEKESRNLTQQAIAQKLGVNRSVINRQFMGQENLTLRTIGELAWALGWTPLLSFKKAEILEEPVPPLSNSRIYMINPDNSKIEAQTAGNKQFLESAAIANSPTVNFKLETVP